MAAKFNCDLCEHDWLLGAPGVCDEANSTCICPEGFSGVDDWSESSTCHVHENAAFALHLLLFMILIVGLVVSVTVLVLQTRKFGLVSLNLKPEKKISRLMTESFNDNNSRMTFVNSSFETKRAKKKSEFGTRSMRVKRDSLIVLALFVFCCIISLVYHGFFLSRDGKRTSWDDNRPMLPFLFTTSLVTFTSTLNILWITWYLTLPMNSPFGSILGYEPFFQKYHQPFKILNYAVFYTLPLVNFFNLMILPAIIDEPGYMRTATISFCICNIVFVTAFIFYLDAVLRNVIRTYSVAQKTLEDRKAQWIIPSEQQLNAIESQKEGLRKACETAKMMKSFGRVTCIGINISYGLWLMCDGYYQYIFSTAISISPFIAMTHFPLWFYYKTDGGLFPLVSLEGSRS